MKIILNPKLIEDLSLQNKPVQQDLQGEVVFKPAQTPYIVYDSHGSAPVGFGVKVGAISKTYIIQRNIEGRVLKIRVGNVNDFESLNHARAKARQLVQEAIETKTNPSTSRRKKTLTVQAAQQSLEDLLEMQMGKLRMRSEMANLHDDTVISNVTAGIYLNVSTSTLSVWRQTGVGPEFIKYAEHKWTNACVHYKMGELRRYLKEQTKK
jgi:hypothetical protein